MTTRSSMDSLYSAVGAVVLSTTGRQWWRRAGIQTQPVGTYATIYITQAIGQEQDVVENVLLKTPGPNGGLFQQLPWGISKLECKIDFMRSANGDSSLDAATRFKNALRLSARYDDLWKIMGLVGGVSLTDISAIFMQDIEPRAQIRFLFYANVSDPAPLAGTDIYDIDFQQVNVRAVLAGDKQNRSIQIDDVFVGSKEDTK